MAQNYNPQVEYPNYPANGHVMQQFQQHTARSVYPGNHPPDRGAITHGQQSVQQQITDVYQLSRAQTVAPQMVRYPSVSQVPQLSSEHHSPLTGQSAGLPQQGLQSDRVPNPEASTPHRGRYQPQALPPPRPASAFSQTQTQVMSGFTQYTSTPPVSPTRESQFRRPLPQRPGNNSTNLNSSRRPLPDANSPPIVAPPLHRPSYSADTTRALPSPAYFVSSSANQGAGSSQLHAPRPLPDPIPRSSRSLDLTRSPSPIKQVLDHPDLLPKPGQKFVPMWKRALPIPSRPTVMSNQLHTMDRPSANSGSSVEVSSNIQSSVLQRSKTTTVRPLPPSPRQKPTYSTPQTSPSRSTFVSTNFPGSSSPPKSSDAFVTQNGEHAYSKVHSASRSGVSPRSDPVFPSAGFSGTSNGSHASIVESPISSDGEDIYNNPLLRRPDRDPSTSSPTYGIRDLPSRMNRSADHASMSTVEQERFSAIDTLSVKTQSGGPRSMASRIAALTLTKPPQLQTEQTLSRQPASPPKPVQMAPAMERNTSSSARRWPANLPPLPRAPQQPDAQKSPVQVSHHALTGTSWEYIQKSSSSDAVSPTRSHLTQRDSSPTRPLPSTPQSPSARNMSPTRPFPSLRHPSPVRSQQAPSLPSPHNEPSSPTRSQPFNNVSPSEVSRGRVFPRAAPHGWIALPNLDDAPPPSLRKTPSPNRPSTFPSQAYNLPNIRTHDVGGSPVASTQLTSPPSIVTPSSAGSSTFSLSAFPAPPQSNPGWGASAPRSSGHQGNLPSITFCTEPEGHSHHEDHINLMSGPSIAVSGPGEVENRLSQSPLSGADADITIRGPIIAIGNLSGGGPNIPGFDSKLYHQLRPVVEVDDYPPCLGCGALIIGDAVNAMNGRWHPRCYRCCVCHESLEMLAPIEHEGKVYCTLDYHEKFSPRCYHCSSVIVDSTYITLNDKELGQRTYHDQHFFCSECGDPFVTPGMKNRTFEGDGPFEGGEVGATFTVFRGFPYCSKCHAKLRWPKCKKCRKSMAPDSDIIEALGAKWCTSCFVCTNCQSPFTNGKLFMRDSKPFCQDCFEIMIKNEM